MKASPGFNLKVISILGSSIISPRRLYAEYQFSILSNGTSFTADIERLLKRIASSSPFEDSSMIGRLDLRCTSLLFLYSKRAE